MPAVRCRQGEKFCQTDIGETSCSRFSTTEVNTNKLTTISFLNIKISEDTPLMSLSMVDRTNFTKIHRLLLCLKLNNDIVYPVSEAF